MKIFIASALIVFSAATVRAQEPFSLFKLGDFKYVNQKIAVLPYECDEARLCDEIEDVFPDLMFDYFDTNYVSKKKVKKALKQAKLKKLLPENMAAIANHLQIDVFVTLNLEIEKKAELVKDVTEDATQSSLLKVELILLDPRDGAAIMKVQSVGKGSVNSIQQRFEDIFRRGFEIK